MQKAENNENKELYNSAAAARFYGLAASLQPAEIAILDTLRPSLANMSMLDVGAGAGRTAQHFARLVRKYEGVDFSEGLTAVARRKFPALTFEIGDAENLSQYSDGSVDFVLFSFNGIDCLNLAGRRNALREFQRVLRPGGFLAFSSHNTNFIPGFATAQSLHKSLWARFRRRLRFHRRVRSVAIDGEWANVIEIHFGHRVKLVYATPSRQVKELENEGWRDIQVFPGDSGTQFDGNSDAAKHIEDPWVYYLCRKDDAGERNSVVTGAAKSELR